MNSQELWILLAPDIKSLIFKLRLSIKSKQECKKYQTIPFSSVSGATHLNNVYVFVFTFY